LKCKDCGAVGNDGDVICQSCGAKLAKENDESADMPGTPEVTGDGEASDVNISTELEDGITEEGDHSGESGNDEGDAEVNIDDSAGSENVNGDPELGAGEETNYGDQIDLQQAKKRTGLVAALSAAALVIIALAVYIGFFGGYDTITTVLGISNKHPLTYIKDNGFYVKNGSNKPEKISGKIFNDESMLQWIAADTQYQNYTMLIRQRKNGKLLYFYDNIVSGNKFSADLSIYKLGGKAQKIAQGVYLNIAVNKDGSQAMFLKDFDYDKNFGDLYLYNGDKAVKIASGVTADSYKFSDDGKTIAYVENLDKSEDVWDLSIQVNGGKKEKVDSGTINLIDVGNDGSTVAYVKPKSKTDAVYDLYVKEKGKETKSVASEIADLMLDRNNNSFFVLADYNAEKKSGALYFKEPNKDKVKIDDNVLGIVKLGKNKFEPDIQFMGNRNSDVLYFKDCDLQKNTGDLYIKLNGSNKVKVASGIALSNPQFSDDLRTIAYYRADDETGDMKLFTANASADNSSYKENSVSDKLANYGNLSKKGNLLVYPQMSADGSKQELFEMKDSEKAVKISSNAFGTAKVSDDGKAFVYGEDNNGVYNLFLKKPGKDKGAVAAGLTLSDVQYTYDFKKIYYTKGYDATSFKGDLYEKETGKALVLVDSGVTMVLFSE